jgi:hypothetical protein
VDKVSVKEWRWRTGREEVSTRKKTANPLSIKRQWTRIGYNAKNQYRK